MEKKAKANRVLVAYYTKSGASEEYAKVIAETLTTNGQNVEMYNLAYDIPDITGFDIVVLGTGVRISRVYRRWKKILKNKALNNKRLFLFLSSGTAIEKPDEAVNKFLRPIVEKYGLKPELLISFPGKMPEKWIKPGGEKETMKPEKAKAWAMEIINKI